MINSSDLRLPQDRLPDAIISELQQSDGVPFGIPPELTEDILQDAHECLASQPVVRPARDWVRFTAVVSSICAALLLFMVSPVTNRDQSADKFAASVPDTELRSLNPKDIDGSGIVDILDAFAMARLLESGESGGHWDFNSDGQMNEDDVQLVAFDAVML